MKKKEVQDEDAFFLNQRGEKMRSFYARLHWLKEAAGIQKVFGTHTLKHNIATHLAMSGMNIEEISRFLGDSSIDSIQIYLHLAHELKNNEHGTF